MNERDTSGAIITCARKILSEKGVSGLSFDKIADRLNVSKQAVLYWYPTKKELLAALFIPWLESEVEAVKDALKSANDRKSAINLFIRANAEFHFSNLERFRLMYLVPQTSRGGGSRDQAAFLKEVNRVTDALYSMLAYWLDEDSQSNARAQALAMHSSVLGIVTLYALGDALKDPLKQPQKQLIDSLVSLVNGGDG